MPLRPLAFWLAAALAPALLAPRAVAQDAAYGAGGAGGAEGWSFELVPYLWAASLDGSVGVGPLPEADVDAGFADLFENLDFAASAFLTARRGDLALLADVSYTGLEIEETVAASTVEIDSDLAWVALAAGRRVRSGPGTTLDVFAGARWFAVDNSASSSGLVDGSRTKNEAWIDPLVGVLLAHELRPRLALDLLADVGGFGVGSDLTYEVLPSVSWSFSPCCALRAGYRWLDVDFDDSDFEYDVRQTGFVVGVGLRF